MARSRRTSEAESDAIWERRPLSHQITSTASRQSRPLRDAGELEAQEARVREQLAALRSKDPDARLPRPAYWGGYRVRPLRVEFWEKVRPCCV